jgi:3-oxoacyl-[acyl-carrier-protein] synthase II
MNLRRVVVTGMGVVAPNGIGVDDFWDSIVRGRSAVRRITRFDVSSYPSQVAAEVHHFDPADYMEPRNAKRLDRFAQFAMAAAQMAVQDADVDFGRYDPYRVGVFIGTAIGGGKTIETQHAIFFEKGLRRISPYTAVSVSTHSASGVIACQYKLKGPNTTIAAGCNSGLDAVYLASNAIQLGDADAMLVGASEAPITPFGYAIFCASGFLSRANAMPEKAVKPYDQEADGMVLGEGGAILVLEELQHALERGAHIYGEVVSYSALNEAFDLFGVDTENGTMARNFRQALKKSNGPMPEIDYINAHGNGILSYDINETQAIKEVFGERAHGIPVSSFKPVTGHSISVSAVYQVVTSLLVIRDGLIPPTINLEHPAPQCDLDYVTRGSIKRDVNTVLINAHGFGGRLTALIVRKFLSERVVS